MTQIVRNFAFSTPSLSHGEHGKGLGQKKGLLSSVYCPRDDGCYIIICHQVCRRPVPFQSRALFQVHASILLTTLLRKLIDEELLGFDLFPQVIRDPPHDDSHFSPTSSTLNLNPRCLGRTYSTSFLRSSGLVFHPHTRFLTSSRSDLESSQVEPFFFKC